MQKFSCWFFLNVTPNDIPVKNWFFQRPEIISGQIILQIFIDGIKIVRLLTLINEKI